MKKLATFLIFLLSIIVMPMGIYSQSTEQIHSFNANIAVNKDGTIKVQETIIYDFGADERHGIFRTIPYIKENNQGERFRMDIDIESVTNENGEEYMFAESTVDDDIEIKIGDPDVTITGVHTYVITYNVKGALTYFSDHDELYWNITGTGWQVPILSTSATLTLPIEDMRNGVSTDCWSGAAQNNESNCFTIINSKDVVFLRSTPLQAGEGMTVVMGFPKNTVAELLPTKVVDFADTLLGKLVFFGAIIAGLIWYIVYPLWLPFKWWQAGRDPQSHQGKTTASFDPPETKTGRKLTPAEVGTLIDEHAQMREISALIVSLAQRGYLKIVEKAKKEFELVKTKDIDNDESLQEFEKIFLTELFAVKPKVNLKKAEDLYSVVTTVQQEIYENLVDEGYFPHNPDKVRKRYAILSIIATTTFNILLLITASIFGRIMPRKTLEGVEAANVARSLKNFLESQERQLKFQADKQMMFEKLLPFAISFGVEKIWAERFKDIKMTQPDWYQGTSVHSYSPVSFTNSLNSSMSSFKSAATPTTSSTGHSSGFSGGSVGGGGGGGGGGSW